ncbi:hypothetical protein BKG83_00350 [Mycobacteroides chelonae]|uniref:Uncharacterized protein n=1 Tax=Mycobacteroides chelonae TaxID=1774 RepID=A0A1S1MDE2_MYCCH|nr:hypothetical protein AOT87_20130 [Mycobacteroides sp. H003]KRQ20940.1 hypothetical protein AOT86_21760 [Mycobacteroides sp. H072]KRQ25713.1 hypothetical protein AOT91_21135 [Mycobacteroides sp. H092]KRQ33704.1 hypothetical protein AOT92_26065 [Mycobacteroides sp. H101]KRQ38196.1 hypothetical protein AOT84_10880 [Mycobacteroides sp. H002]KRQ45349.1 hypothetical protein AOT88_21180 [Mycobacteroides sp. H063]KRQ53096.1 hypothetical protein AOT85_07815 [Mycobacteroides sp. H054]KRQ56555.1 hyp
MGVSVGNVVTMVFVGSVVVVVVGAVVVVGRLVVLGTGRGVVVVTLGLGTQVYPGGGCGGAGSGLLIS